MTRSQGIWRTAHADSELVALTAEEQPDGGVWVQSRCRLRRVGAEWTIGYLFRPAGEIAVEVRFIPTRSDLPPLPKLGVQLALPAGFSRIQWLGRGPHETYIDRMDAPFALHQGTVGEQFFAHYTEPGESGNKVDVRWTALSNQDGIGLLAVGEGLLSVNALHHTTDDLQSAKHAFELPPRDVTVLNLDFQQQGVGGDDSWGAWPHQEFMLPCKAYAYTFWLRPFDGSESIGSLARRVQND